MRFSEVAYFSEAVPAMVTFYRNLLDREPVFEAEGLAIFQVDETRILIHEIYTPASGELAPENHIAFSVTNVDDACNELVKRGYTLDAGPQNYDWGRSAYLRDPDRHLIEITQGD